MKEETRDDSWLVVALIIAWIAVILIIIDGLSKEYFNPSKTHQQKESLFERPIDQERLEAIKRQLKLQER